MKLVRFDDGTGAAWGRLEGDRIAALDGPPWAGGQPLRRTVARNAARLLAPVTPSKIVAVASNYPKHAAEMGKATPRAPRLFLKPPSAVIGPGRPIAIPPATTRVDPEGELAVVIGRRMRRVPASAALDHVLGATALNDVTCRDFQRQDGLFARAKGFDTFCPVGPWIDTDLDPSDLALRTVVNGEVRAEGRTSDMVFDLPALLAFASHVMTLEPGDVLTTGTPPGVAPIQAGDEVSVELEGLEPLVNPVVDREDR